MIKLRSGGKGLHTSILALKAMQKCKQARHHCEEQTGCDDTSRCRHGVISLSADRASSYRVSGSLVEAPSTEGSDNLPRSPTVRVAVETRARSRRLIHVST